MNRPTLPRAVAYNHFSEAKNRVEKAENKRKGRGRKEIGKKKKRERWSGGTPRRSRNTYRRRGGERKKVWA